MDELDVMGLDELIEMNRLMDEIVSSDAQVQEAFDEDMAILENPDHPLFNETNERYLALGE